MNIGLKQARSSKKIQLRVVKLEPKHVTVPVCICKVA